MVLAYHGGSGAWLNSISLVFINHHIESGQGIGNDVGFAFNVLGICCIFDNVAKLVRLPCRVGFLLLTDSRYKAIGVRVENEGSALDHVAEVTDGPPCP